MRQRNPLILVPAVLLMGVIACKKEPTSPTPRPAFHEDLNGTALNSGIWVVQPGDGEIVVANGVATLRSSGAAFPVATTRDNPFPAGDFLVRVRMRYLSIAPCGSGFGAVDNFSSGCKPFEIWQDAGGWYIYSGSDARLLGPPPQTDYHVYEWRYWSQYGQYDSSVDGVGVISGVCAPRATKIFFGHPAPTGCGNWTSFEIDYIHIEPL